MNIGIDTHGYDQPPERDEFTEEELEKLSELEEQIMKLASEFEKISGRHVTVTGL